MEVNKTKPRKPKSVVSAVRAAKRISKGLVKYHLHNNGRKKKDTESVRSEDG